MYTFKKEERLRSKKQIEHLFSTGHNFYIYPFKVIYNCNRTSEFSPARILLTVSRKNFRRAVERNKVKRLMRESYRLNKHILNDYLQTTNKHCNFALIYTAKNIIPFRELEEKIIEVLERLIQNNEKTVK